MSSYFSHLPNIDYLRRETDYIGDYSLAKNLFKRIKLREIFRNKAVYFTKYQIVGDERPDNVAYKIYDDASLDWVVLLSNNIIDINSEWPLTQRAFDDYLLKKYGTYDKVYDVHHYETIEIKNRAGEVILPRGIIVESDYKFEYYDYYDGGLNSEPFPIKAITNYDIEERYQTEKRSIDLLKAEYLPIAFDDIKKLMTYNAGGTQYVNPRLKRVSEVKITS